MRSSIDFVTIPDGLMLNQNSKPRGNIFVIVFRVLKNYAKEILWEKNEQLGFSFIKKLWNAGFLGRMALLLLLIVLICTVILLNFPEIQRSNYSIFLGIVGMITAFSYLTVFGILQSSIIFFIISAYLCWFLLPVGIRLSGTLISALPVLWLLILGWLNTIRNQKTWQEQLGFLLLCLGAGQLLFRSFSLDNLIPDYYSLLARIVLGILFWLILTINWIKNIFKKFIYIFEKSYLIFILSLVIYGSFLLLSILKDQKSTTENLLLTMQQALGFADFFWFWIGWSVLAGVVKFAEFGVRQSEFFFSLRWLKFLSPFLWGISLVFCWVSTHQIPLSILHILNEIGFLKWTYSWSDSFYFSIYYFTWLNATVFGISLILVIIKKLTPKSIRMLNILWIGSFFCIFSFYQSLFQMNTLDVTGDQSMDAWSSFLLAGGILWQLAKDSEIRWSSNSKSIVFFFSSILLFMISMIAVTLGANLPDFVSQYTFYSFMGTLFLGFPLAIYTLLQQITDVKPVDGKYLLFYFLSGCFSAMICLIINPFTGWHLMLAPVFWGLAISILQKKAFIPDQGLQSVISGAALSLGFSTFWLSPEYIPIPFLSVMNRLQLRYLTIPLDRPLLLPQQFYVMLSAVAIGALFFWLWTQRPKTTIRTINVAVSSLLLWTFFSFFLPAA
jgi:hypothetical protein